MSKIDKIVKVLEDNAYLDDYGDLNISEQDYSKIATTISEIPCDKCKELEKQSAAMEESYIEELDKLKGKCKELEEELTKRIEAHNGTYKLLAEFLRENEELSEKNKEYVKEIVKAYVK